MRCGSWCACVRMVCDMVMCDVVVSALKGGEVQPPTRVFLRIVCVLQGESAGPVRHKCRPGAAYPQLHVYKFISGSVCVQAVWSPRGGDGKRVAVTRSLAQIAG